MSGKNFYTLDTWITLKYMGKFGVDQAVYTPKEFITTKINDAGGEFVVSKPYLKIDERGMVTFEPSKKNYEAMVAILEAEGSVFRIVNAGRFAKNVKPEWYYTPEGESTSSEDLSDLPVYKDEPEVVVEPKNEVVELTEDQLIDKLLAEAGTDIESWGLSDLRSMSGYLELGIVGRSKDEFVPFIIEKLKELGKIEIEETETED